MITPDVEDIYPEGLKLLMLLADLLNGIIFESGNIGNEHARATGLLAFLIPGILFVVFSPVYMIVCLVYTWKKIVDDEDGKLLKITQMLLTFLSSFVGVIIYFIADNYYLVQQIREDNFQVILNETSTEIGTFVDINNIQPPLLALGIIFHRAVPKAIKTFFKPCTKEASKILDDRDSIYIGVYTAATSTIEFDALFTAIQTGNCSSSNLNTIWTLWAAIITIYGLVLVTRSVIGYYITSEDNEGKYFDVTWGAVVISAVLLAFVLYLLGDNRQPLDCYSSSISAMNRSIIRLTFLLLSFCFYSFACIFFCTGVFYDISKVNDDEGIPLQPTWIWEN